MPIRQVSYGIKDLPIKIINSLYCSMNFLPLFVIDIDLVVLSCHIICFCSSSMKWFIILSYDSPEVFCICVSLVPLLLTASSLTAQSIHKIVEVYVASLRLSIDGGM